MLNQRTATINPDFSTSNKAGGTLNTITGYRRDCKLLSNNGDLEIFIKYEFYKGS
jgi:hypothetical protein